MRLQLITFALCMLLVASGPMEFGGPRVEPPSRLVPGTYSDLTYNEEGGDLLGIEIKIVPIVGERYQAVVLESIGEPQPMHIVDVRVSGTSISFEVPKDAGTSWSFRGTVSAKSLKGTINGRRTVVLKRGCGYWDR